MNCYTVISFDDKVTFFEWKSANLALVLKKGFELNVESMPYPTVEEFDGEGNKLLLWDGVDLTNPKMKDLLIKVQKHDPNTFYGIVLNLETNRYLSIGHYVNDNYNLRIVPEICFDNPHEPEMGY